MMKNGRIFAMLCEVHTVPSQEINNLSTQTARQPANVDFCPSELRELNWHKWLQQINESQH